MVKKKAKSSKVLVSVSRFGEDPVAVSLKDGDTVGDALEFAEIDLESNQKVFISGEEVSVDDEVEMGDILSIVTPKAAGANA